MRKLQLAVTRMRIVTILYWTIPQSESVSDSDHPFGFNFLFNSQKSIYSRTHISKCSVNDELKIGLSKNVKGWKTAISLVWWLLWGIAKRSEGAVIAGWSSGEAILHRGPYTQLRSPNQLHTSLIFRPVCHEHPVIGTPQQLKCFWASW